MKQSEIQELLEKYFAGESTLQEEELLRIYFQAPVAEIPKQYLPYRPLFNFFEDERTVTMGRTVRNRRILSREYGTFGKIAATIAILAAAWWLVPQANTSGNPEAFNWEAHQPETPEEAYRVTRSAFLRLAGELNQGAKMAAQEMEKVKTLSNSINMLNN